MAVRYAVGLWRAEILRLIQVHWQMATKQANWGQIHFPRRFRVRGRIQRPPILRAGHPQERFRSSLGLVEEQSFTRAGAEDQIKWRDIQRVVARREVKWPWGVFGPKWDSLYWQLQRQQRRGTRQTSRFNKRIHLYRRIQTRLILGTRQTAVPQRRPIHRNLPTRQTRRQRHHALRRQRSLRRGLEARRHVRTRTTKSNRP